MVVKPKSYNKNILGGYLLNDVNYREELIINKNIIKDKSLVKDDNIIYNMINGISSIAYKINTELFDYLLINLSTLTMKETKGYKRESYFGLVRETDRLGIIGNYFYRKYSTGANILYKGNKNKVVNVYFWVTDFNNLFDFSVKMLDTKLPINNVYTVFVKVRYNKNSFFMVGNQFGFSFNKDFEVLFNDVKARLEEYFTYYNLVDEDIVYVQVSFRLLDRMIYSDLVINIDRLENISVTEIRAALDLITIPTTTEEDSLGKCLSVILDSNNNVKQVDVIIKDVKYNFLDIILEKTKYIRSNHIDIVTQFDSRYKFYYIKSNIDYILVIKELDNKIEKYKYSTSGVLLSKIIDWYDGNILVRSKGSETMYIENNNVCKTINLINFKPIEDYKIKKVSWLPNSNIGVIDIETYLNNDNINEIYALGFRTKLNPHPVVYYINDNYDSSALVLSMIDELLRTKYSDITFYCHNFASYDVIFILKILNNYNDNKKDKYNLSFVFRDDRVIKLTIRKDNKTLNILDSYCILTSKLESIINTFKRL